MEHNSTHILQQIQSSKHDLHLVLNDINQPFPENIDFYNAKPILFHQSNTLQQKLDFYTNLLLQGQIQTLDGLAQVFTSVIQLRKEVQELKHKKNSKNTLKIQLRDPISKDEYDLFMLGAGNQIKRLKILRTAQLRLIYTLLFHFGFRINEVKLFTKNDLILAYETGRIHVVHTKTNTAQQHVLSINGRKRLKSLAPEIELLFDRYSFPFLGSSKPDLLFNKENFIRFVNDDMKQTCNKYNLLQNYSSHSFRIGFITTLLKTVPLHTVAQIIGHKDVESTMAYHRYVVDQQQIEEFLKHI